MRLLLIICILIGVNARLSYLKDNRKWPNSFPFPPSDRADHCKNHYTIRDGEKEVVVHCPEGLVYNGNQCYYREETPGCPEYKSDWYLYKSNQKDSICKRRVDGHYNFPCENTHYSCKNGTVTWHKCPEGFIYYHDSCLEDKCIKKEHVKKCWPMNEGYEGEDPRCVDVKTPRRAKINKRDPKKEFSCRYKRNGHYQAGRCLNHYYVCIYFKQITANCPEGMVFHNHRCRFNRDVKQCPEYKTDLDIYHSKNKTEKNSICEIRGDGPYKFPCENKIYICRNGKTLWSKCPNGEAFDSWWHCKKRIHHDECPEFEAPEIKEIDPNVEGPEYQVASQFSIEN